MDRLNYQFFHGFSIIWYFGLISALNADFIKFIQNIIN